MESVYVSASRPAVSHALRMCPSPWCSLTTRWQSWLTASLFKKSAVIATRIYGHVHRYTIPHYPDLKLDVLRFPLFVSTKSKSVTRPKSNFHLTHTRSHTFSAIIYGSFKVSDHNVCSDIVKWNPLPFELQEQLFLSGLIIMSCKGWWILIRFCTNNSEWFLTVLINSQYDVDPEIRSIVEHLLISKLQMSSYHSHG